MSQEYEEMENQKPLHWSSGWFDGCITGGCLGALGAPLLFILLLEILYRVAGNFDAEGVPFFLIMSVPAGGIAGSIAYPILRIIVLLIIAKFKNRSKPQ